MAKRDDRDSRRTPTGRVLPPLDHSRKPYSPEFRLKVVRLVLDDGYSIAAVARSFEVGGATLGDWIRRYLDGGEEGLRPKTRVSARASKPEPRRDAVKDLKRTHPEYGTRRIRDILKRFEGLGISESTVRRILHEEGLLETREPVAKKQQPSPKRFERAAPNQLWQSDLFTFLLRRHQRIYVAAFLDDHSRYLVSLVMAHHQRSSLVMEALARAIADYGTPQEILTDQGRQYTAWRGETDFEEELRRNGIRHVKSRPHHPQTCGKIERFWKTMWEEFLSRTVFSDFDDCQRRIGLFVQHYNFQRPHQALDGMTPADRFFRSAPQVRAAIEKAVAENALRLAQQQPQQKPFYLVGRFGDRDLTISTKGSGLAVRLGDEEQTITLPKEDLDDERTKASRWDAGRKAEEAAFPTDAEVAEDSAEPGRSGASAVPDGPVGSLGGEASERRDRGGEDLSRDVLPDGDAGAERDTRRAQSGRIDGGRAGSGTVTSDHGARSARSAAGAGEAPRGTSSADDPEGDPSLASDVGTGAAAEERPQLDAEWEESFEELEEDDGIGGERDPFDPDERWRDDAVTWERKLSGADDRRDPFTEESASDEEEDLYRSASDPARARGAISDRHGRSERDDPRGQSGAASRDVAQPLPDVDASRAGSTAGGDHPEAGRPAEEAGARSGPGGGVGTSPEGERQAEEPGGDDGPDAGSREWLSAWTDPAKNDKEESGEDGE
jgi:transposase InsO family protein